MGFTMSTATKCSLLFFLVLLLASCAEQSEPEKVILDIPVVKITSQDVPIFIEMVGQTLGSRDIPIRARVDGTIESMHFQEGRNVKENQLLSRAAVSSWRPIRLSVQRSRII